MWDVLHARPRRPDAFVFAGDNVYADAKLHPLRSPTSKAGLEPGERPRFVPLTRAEHKAMYDEQREVPGYARLLRTTTVVGTWDDHDAGINDADKFFAFKDERQQLFLDFFDVPKDSPRRTRKGVYHSHVLTDAEGRTVKLLLLDVRYHRDPWPWHPGALPAEKSDILGEEQWAWLERELSETSGDINLVVSGFQFLGVTLLDRTKHESWWHFMAARQRLIDLLHVARSPVVLLSGDVHFAEVSACYSTSMRNRTKKKKVVEFTSSGLTHAWASSAMNWPKPMAAALVFRCAWYLWSCIGVHPWRVKAYPGLNFGEIEVDHDHRTVDMRVIDAHGNVALSESVRFDELPGGDTPSSKDFESVQCRPINGDPPPGRLRLASLTMAAVGLGLVCCVFCIACAVAVFVYRKIKKQGRSVIGHKKEKGE
eukprot:g598.t1